FIRGRRHSMPWELTIRRPGGEPLGNRDEVIRAMSTALPAIDWVEEPPLLEQIKDMPEHSFHKLLPTWPAETREHFARPRLRGDYDAGEFVIQFFGFEAQPIVFLLAEVRGNGNPLPPLAKLCSVTGWAAMEAGTTQPIDLTADEAEGWKRFCEYRAQV